MRRPPPDTRWRDRGAGTEGQRVRPRRLDSPIEIPVGAWTTLSKPLRSRPRAGVPPRVDEDGDDARMTLRQMPPRRGRTGRGRPGDSRTPPRRHRTGDRAGWRSRPGTRGPPTTLRFPSRVSATAPARHVRAARRIDPQHLGTEGERKRVQTGPAITLVQIEDAHTGQGKLSRRATGAPGRPPPGDGRSVARRPALVPADGPARRRGVRTPVAIPPAAKTRSSMSSIGRPARTGASASASAPSAIPMAQQERVPVPRVVGVRPDPAIGDPPEPRQRSEAGAGRPPLHAEEPLAADGDGDMAAIEANGARPATPLVCQRCGGQERRSHAPDRDVLHGKVGGEAPRCAREAHAGRLVQACPRVPRRHRRPGLADQVLLSCHGIPFLAEAPSPVARPPATSRTRNGQSEPGTPPRGHPTDKPGMIDQWPST